jgi:hypothetical protein
VAKAAEMLGLSGLAVPSPTPLMADKRAISLQYQCFAGRSGALVCVKVDEKTAIDQWLDYDPAGKFLPNSRRAPLNVVPGLRVDRALYSDPYGVRAFGRQIELNRLGGDA